MMNMNYNKLRARMVECSLCQKEIAEFIGVSESHFCQKMAGKYAFKQSEIRKICEILHIETGQIGDYFFSLNS